MLLTAKGQSVRCGVATIRESNRGAKGVKLLTLAEGDKLLSIAKVVESDEEIEIAENLAASEAAASEAPTDETPPATE